MKKQFLTRKNMLFLFHFVYRSCRAGDCFLLKRYVRKNVSNGIAAIARRNFATSPQCIPEIDKVTAARTQFENNHLYKIMLSDALYSNTLAYLDDVKVSSSCETAREILASIDEASLEPHNGLNMLQIVLSAALTLEKFETILKSEKFELLCNRLILGMSDLSDANILKLMKILTLWPDHLREGYFYSICKAVDDSCILRFTSHGTDTSLLIMDHFYRLKVLRYSQFVWLNIKRLSRKCKGLTSKQLVHFMFLINAHRKFHPVINMFELECALENCLDEMTVEEAGIVALAFFKTSTPITSHALLEALYKKVLYRLNSMHPITLTAFLKIFRLSFPLTFENHIRILLTSLTSIIDKLSFLCCIHASLLGTKIILFHPESLHKIARRFVAEIDQARLKDMERLTMAMTLYNYEPKTTPPFYPAVLKELNNARRLQEREEYAKSYVLALSFLSLRSYYDYDSLDTVLSEEFLKKTYVTRNQLRFDSYVVSIQINGVFRGKLSGYSVPREVLALSNNVKLEYPNYMGSDISAELKKQIATTLCWKMPKWNKGSRMDNLTLEMERVLLGMFQSSDYVRIIHVLPHLPRPDIIFCLDELNNPVMIPSHMRGTFLEELKEPPRIGTWYCVTMIGFNSTRLGTLHPTGNTSAKIRQLHKLNYKPLIVLQNVWEMKCDLTRRQYILSLIERSKLCDFEVLYEEIHR